MKTLGFCNLRLRVLTIRQTSTYGETVNPMAHRQQTGVQFSVVRHGHIVNNVISTTCIRFRRTNPISIGSVMNSKMHCLPWLIVG